tara:strand:+ start:104 stop:214 length:111 start_codon:yes stop_codon:yes gene_type:complete
MKCLSCKKGTIVGNECQICYTDFEIEGGNENDKENI